MSSDKASGQTEYFYPINSNAFASILFPIACLCIAAVLMREVFQETTLDTFHGILTYVAVSCLSVTIAVVGLLEAKNTLAEHGIAASIKAWQICVQKDGLSLHGTLDCIPRQGELGTAQMLIQKEFIVAARQVRFVSTSLTPTESSKKLEIQLCDDFEDAELVEFISQTKEGLNFSSDKKLQLSWSSREVLEALSELCPILPAIQRQDDNLGFGDLLSPTANANANLTKLNS